MVVTTVRIRTRTNKLITCARCGSANAQRSKYCNNCGFRFADWENIGIMNQRPTLSSVASSPSSSLIKTAEQKVGKFVTCELPAYGIKINYPSNWLRIEQGLKPSLVVIFTSPMENSSDTLLKSVGISSYTITNVKLEQFIQEAISDLKKRNHDLSVIESGPNKLAGQEAYKIVFDLGGKRYMAIVTRKENKAYQIMYVAEPAKYDSYFPIVQKMLDSFEITNKGHQ